MENKQNPKQNEMLKDENEFLKMKIIAEHGVHFSSGKEQMNVPPDLENDFLKHIIEFEKQFELNKKIKVFEKIGKPQHFKLVNEIFDAEIEKAWQTLSAHMSDYGIQLSACSPKVTSRELYRFATEELFELEIDDIDIPGMMNGFIYDEFYPDVEL